MTHRNLITFTLAACTTSLSLALAAGCTEGADPADDNVEAPNADASDRSDAGSPSQDLDVPAFIHAIGEAHNESTYSQQQAVRADFVVDFGDAFVLDGEMLFDTAVGRTKLMLEHGATLVYNEGDAYATGPDVPMARFHALTWPYFFAAPFKLDDPGAQFSEMQPQPTTDGNSLPAYRLAFEQGIGDSPDDWYYVLRAEDDPVLAGLVYIVTYGKSKEEAEQSPSLVTYDAVTNVVGVQMPSELTFYRWREGEGATEQKGTASLSNIRFVALEGDEFQRPENARTLEAPGQSG